MHIVDVDVVCVVCVHKVGRMSSLYNTPTLLWAAVSYGVCRRCENITSTLGGSVIRRV